MEKGGGGRWGGSEVDGTTGVGVESCEDGSGMGAVESRGGSWCGGVRLGRELNLLFVFGSLCGGGGFVLGRLWCVVMKWSGWSV